MLLISNASQLQPRGKGRQVPTTAGSRFAISKTLLTQLIGRAMGVFYYLMDWQCYIASTIKKFTMKSWRERGRPEQGDVCIGAVKKGVEKPESTPRGSAGIKITSKVKGSFNI